MIKNDKDRILKNSVKNTDKILIEVRENNLINQTDLKNVNGNIKDLKNEMVFVKDQIDQVKDDVSLLKEGVVSIKDSVDYIKSEVKAQGARQEQLIHGLVECVENGFEKVDNDIAEIKSIITKIPIRSVDL